MHDTYAKIEILGTRKPYKSLLGKYHDFESILTPFWLPKFAPVLPKPKQDETESSAVSLLEKAEACYHTTSERIQVSGAFGTLGFPYCVHVFRSWISKHFKKYELTIDVSSMFEGFLLPNNLLRSRNARSGLSERGLTPFLLLSAPF